MQFPGAPTHEGRYDFNGIISNIVLVNSGFHMQKNFSENIRNLGTRPSPVLGWISLKISVLGDATLLALPGRPRLGPALTPAPLF